MLKQCRALHNNDRANILSLVKYIPPQLNNLRRNIFSLHFLAQSFQLQPILKGFPGDADHVSNTDCLERSGVCEFVGRSTADTENGCDVIHGVCSALGRPFFVGAHKMILPANSILKCPLEALCHKGFLLIPC